jgi:acetyltransferase-like isoleucine patch superfamily enzyme
MKVGKNTYISPTATIKGERVEIGDGCYIGDGVQILVDDFVMGDYCKIHNKSTLHGYKPMRIGHNAWIGQGTIIDSIGGTSIGDNCGIGAYSQLWSHIRHGDPLEGCNYNSEKSLTIGSDVWFVGHCIVSPIVAEDRSMALVGSVVTKDMMSDRVYAGTPAKDITSDKVLPQFTPLRIEDKREIISNLDVPDGIVFIEDDSEIVDDNNIYFNFLTRKYTKKSTDLEHEFMKYLQSKLIKFTPYANIKA